MKKNNVKNNMKISKKLKIPFGFGVKSFLYSEIWEISDCSFCTINVKTKIT